MRSIKFRAWDNVAGEMFYCGEDVDILFTLGSAGIECTDIRNVSPSGDGVDDMEHLNYMQYTGLTDKNGKEIYEGDVYHMGDPNITYTVVWHDTGLIGKQNGASSYAGLSHWESRIEVIGNRFEHPHLLEEEE